MGRKGPEGYTWSSLVIMLVTYRHRHIIQNNCFKVQGHPGLNSTFEASLGHMKTLFKKKNKKERKEGRKKR